MAGIEIFDSIKIVFTPPSLTYTIFIFLFLDVAACKLRKFICMNISSSWGNLLRNIKLTNWSTNTDDERQIRDETKNQCQHDLQVLIVVHFHWVDKNSSNLVCVCVLTNNNNFSPAVSPWNANKRQSKLQISLGFRNVALRSRVARYPHATVNMWTRRASERANAHVAVTPR